MNYKELENEVIKWADSKGILANGTPYAQANKTIEEANEILSAIIDNDKAEIIDGLGDVLVTIIIQAKLQNVDYYAYKRNVRTKMVNGEFIKD